MSNEDRGVEIRLHERHTSASLALAAGIPIGVVSGRLGHAKTSIALASNAISSIEQWQAQAAL